MFFRLTPAASFAVETFRFATRPRRVISPSFPFPFCCLLVVLRVGGSLFEANRFFADGEGASSVVVSVCRGRKRRVQSSAIRYGTLLDREVLRADLVVILA